MSNDTVEFQFRKLIDNENNYIDLYSLALIINNASQRNVSKIVTNSNTLYLMPKQSLAYFKYVAQAFLANRLFERPLLIEKSQPSACIKSDKNTLQKKHDCIRPKLPSIGCPHRTAAAEFDNAFAFGMMQMTNLFAWTVIDTIMRYWRMRRWAPIKPTICLEVFKQNSTNVDLIFPKLR